MIFFPFILVIVNVQYLSFKIHLGKPHEYDGSSNPHISLEIDFIEEIVEVLGQCISQGKHIITLDIFI